jgi:cytochrome oxidase Cu insertion factor (SCO1/SenC/PrrC family)
MKVGHLAAAVGWALAASTALAQEPPPPPPPTPPDPPALKVGDKAPDFKLKGSDGKEYTLKEFAGKQGVVVAWFPKAFTGG